MDPFAAARDQMVETQLRRRGIADPRVLEVMGTLPREAFLAGSLARDPWEAYKDSALPAGKGQTLSQPYMVALMTEALSLTPGDRVLEIGTGTGYQTAILAMIAEEVWSVERDPDLGSEARERLRNLGLENVRLRVGDGTLGWPEGAPYQAILVTAGAPRIPDSLLAQLGDGGRLVIPVGSRTLQDLLRVTREGDEVSSESLVECRFVPLVGEEGWRNSPDPTA